MRVFRKLTSKYVVLMRINVFWDNVAAMILSKMSHRPIASVTSEILMSLAPCLRLS